MSEHEYRQLVRDLVESGHDGLRPKHEIREEIVHRVQVAADAGEVWATNTLTRWETEGADRDYTAAFKDLNTVTYVRANGRRVRKTVGYSVPMRSKDDGAIVGRQMQAWWGMSRAAVEELRREMYGQGRRLAETVVALDQLIAAWDEHPECVTAREAWEAAGHDVSEIELSEVAA